MFPRGSVRAGLQGKQAALGQRESPKVTEFWPGAASGRDLPRDLLPTALLPADYHWPDPASKVLLRFKHSSSAQPPFGRAVNIALRSNTRERKMATQFLVEISSQRRNESVRRPGGAG